MAAVVANYNINISEIKANMGAETCQSPEVEAILKAAADDTIWKTIDGFKGKDMNTQKKMIDDMMATGHCARLGIPLPEPVDPTNPHVIEIAEFAVEKYNEKTGKHLVFNKVIGGLKWGLVVGTFYLLAIETQDSKGTYKDYAIVFETILGQRKLLWYKH